MDKTIDYIISPYGSYTEGETIDYFVNPYSHYAGNGSELTEEQRKIQHKFNNEKLGFIIKSYNNSLETGSINMQKALWGLLYAKFEMKKNNHRVRE